MSLGNINVNLRNSSGSLYAMQKDRIMREAKERQKTLVQREVDNLKRSVSTDRFKHGQLTSEIAIVRRQLLDLNRKRSDPSAMREIRMKEERIRTLEAEQRRLYDDINRASTKIRDEEYKMRN